MKKLWRDVRGVLQGAAAQAAIKIVVGLLALLGAGTALDPSVGQAAHDALAVAVGAPADGRP